MRPDAALARALVRWQHAAGPYWSFVCGVPFLGGEVREKLNRGFGASDRPRRIIAELPPGPPLAVYLDLSPGRTLALAPTLNQMGYYTVPVVRRWVASPAVLPCTRLVARLEQVSQQLVRPRNPRGVVFFLDGERAGPRSRRGARPDQTYRVFDNRYTYPACLFPTPEFLRAEGIGRVLWVSAGEIAPDLQAYGRRLADAGLAPETVAPAASGPE